MYLLWKFNQNGHLKEKEKFNWFLNIDLHDCTFPRGESFDIIHDFTNIDKLSNHAHTQ